MLNLYHADFRKFMASALTRSFGTEHAAGGDVDEALFRETYGRYLDERGTGLDGVFAAVARAYSAVTDRPTSDLRYFAVKRPVDVECRAVLLKQAFPQAKYILLRDPRTRYVSVKSRLARQPRLARMAGLPLRRIRSFDGCTFPFVQGIAMNSLVSFEMAKRNRQLLGEDYLVLRYEDLSADAPRAMAGIAKFLGIPYDAGLVAPTQRGAAFDGNSSARENFSGRSGTCMRTGSAATARSPRRVSASWCLS